MSTPTRAELGAYLVSSRIAGSVATPRDNNLGNYQRMSNREPLYLFGLEPTGAWTPADVLALMAERCGVSPDPGYRRGPERRNESFAKSQEDHGFRIVPISSARRHSVLHLRCGEATLRRRGQRAPGVCGICRRYRP